MLNITIPLFPLNGAILFPGSSLPLNIFEKKYLDMIDFSLSSERLIGMIQQQQNGNLYKIGCVGKINSFSETNDGRYIVNLVGKDFYSIISEVPNEHKFTIAKVEIHSKRNQYNEKKLEKVDKLELAEVFKRYAMEKKIQIDFNLLNEIEDENLVNFIAMSCPFSVADKQMLLETFDIKLINKKLINLFKFYLEDEKISKIIN
jgi:Lon protease-like protein